MIGARVLAAAIPLIATLWPAVATAENQASSAPLPRVAPEAGYVLRTEVAVDRFTVQRWVSQDAPEVSPAGFCECITIVFDGDRLVLNLGREAGITRVESSGADVTGDGRPEIVVTRHSNGAHCCGATTIYSVEPSPRELLSIATGNCTGRLTDLDGDGIPEFETCDDRFAYEFCSFAFSPLPTIVFAYDRSVGAFEVATPRFARHYDDQRRRALADARQTLNDYRGDAEIEGCVSLNPALSLVYAGRIDDARALFRELYIRADGLAIERRAFDMAMSSPFWVSR